jgi:hypothetical protein
LPPSNLDDAEGKRRTSGRIFIDLPLVPCLVRRLLASQEFILTGVSMKVTRNLGMLLLGVWLIATGLIPLLNLSFSGLGTIMAVLAIAAGVLIIVGR